jgi:SOS-response transcriptional repressor LexA
MNTPTAKQQEVLDFLKAYRKARGYSPSTREIQEYFGFQSQTAAVNHLKALAKKGLVKVHPNISRAVVPVGERISYEDGAFWSYEQAEGARA